MYTSFLNKGVRKNFTITETSAAPSPPSWTSVAASADQQIAQFPLSLLEQTTTKKLIKLQGSKQC